MKKRNIAVLSLLLAFVMCLGAIPVGAAEATATFVVDGLTVATAPVSGGRVTLASTPSIAKGFVGWTATVNGETVLLPAGAVCTGVTENVTFTAVTVSFVTDEGCSVRLRDEQVALRFTSTIARADYDRLVTLAGGAGNIAFGTYIVPAKYVSSAQGRFTIENLASKGYTKYVDVPAGAFYAITDTTATIAGSVGNIRKDNYTMEYSGVGYMKVTYTNGTTSTIYAEFNQIKNSRNILKTVLAAYNDRDVEYDNLVIEGNDSTHSPYTNTELALCRAFLDKVVMVKHNEKYEYFAFPAGYYKSPWKITYTSDQYGRSTISATPPAGQTADMAMGVYLDGLRIVKYRIESGVLKFEHSSYITVE